MDLATAGLSLPGRNLTVQAHLDRSPQPNRLAGTGYFVSRKEKLAAVAALLVHQGLFAMIPI